MPHPMGEADLILPALDWPDLPPNVGALATTRRGGFSTGPYGDGSPLGGGLNLGTHVGDVPDTVARNRALLAACLPTAPTWLSQVHGIAVVEAAAAAPAAVPAAAPNQPPEADASIASTPGAVCAIMTADCLPVLFADLDGRVVGAAHAGWRGLAGGVLGATVGAMRAAGAGAITAWLGPAIGADAFEVGADVLAAFETALPGQAASAFRPYPDRPGKYLADMNRLARALLARDGVTSVHGGGRCTASEAAWFYSYRRDGVTGRQASLIWIK